MSIINIYSDGGSRGNPGPAAYGFVIKTVNPKSQILNPKPFDCAHGRQILNSKFQTIKGSKYIGKATNNQAEYQGILNALKRLKLQVTSYKLQVTSIICYLDSQLIVEQMKGNYKIKNEGLKPLYWEIRQLIMDLGGNVRFEHITRDKNTEADKLVNEEIDKILANSNFKL